MIRESLGLYRNRIAPGGGFANREGAITEFTKATEMLVRRYIDNPSESKRREAARARRELYKGGGLEHMFKVIETFFSDAEVRKLREAIAPFAGYDNALKRVIDEISTVYLSPATRQFDPVEGREDDGDELNDRYKRLLRNLRQHEIMLRLNRRLNLQNDMLLWFRARQLEPDFVDEDGELVGGKREPVLETIDPDGFWAVCHPSDPTHLVGLIIDLSGASEDSGDASRPTPKFRVWDSVETWEIDHRNKLIPGSIRANPFGRVPGLLVHREPPDGQLLDPESGQDLVAAHLMAWFESVLLIKESKSANKQAAFFGDLSTTPTGQAQDTSSDLVLGDGVGVQTVERGVDLAQFRETADHIIERAAANRGIPPSVLRHQGATSGFEIALRRLALTEARRIQIPIYREIERRLVELQAVILEVDIPAMALEPLPGEESEQMLDRWSIDFGEVDVPQEPKALLEFWRELRQMGLANSAQFMRHLNPDLASDAEALDAIRQNVEVELFRNQFMRPLQQLNGSLSQELENARTAEQNGVAGLPSSGSRAGDEDDQ